MQLSLIFLVTTEEAKTIHEYVLGCDCLSFEKEHFYDVAFSFFIYLFISRNYFLAYEKSTKIVM